MKKTMIAIVGLLALGTSGPVGEETLKEELVRISAIESSIERLDAYDAIARRYQASLVPPVRTVPASAGKWNIRTDTSPIDDAPTVIAVLKAESPILSGVKRTTPALVIRHSEGELQAYIVFDTYLGIRDVDATIRFGGEPSKQVVLGISTDRKAGFIRDNVADFVNRLEKVDTFIVRLTPYGESSVTATFHPAGITVVKDAIREALN